MTDSSSRIAVTGASGMVGEALLASQRSLGRSAVVLSRSGVGPGRIAWDPRGGVSDTAQLEGLAAVVHLAGASVAGRCWTAAYRDTIRTSRVGPTRRLAEQLAGLAQKPAVLICASAVGYYGEAGDSILDEGTAKGRGFLADVCEEWEASADPARAAGIRTVHLRFGMILSPAGGALKKMLPAFRFGLGGRLGSGRQWWSWVTLADVTRVIEFAIKDAGVAGPVNVTAPGPVRNSEFTATLARILHRPVGPPAPRFALRLALGGMADELLLASARTTPRALLDRGFEFSDPALEPALRRMLGRA